MHKNIRQLEIPVHDFVLDDGLEGIQNLYKELNGFLLIQGLLLFQINRQIAFITVLQNQVKIIGRFLDIIQFDNVTVITCLQHFDLVL